jgi:hypothetical protein
MNIHVQHKNNEQYNNNEQNNNDGNKMYLPQTDVVLKLLMLL